MQLNMLYPQAFIDEIPVSQDDLKSIENGKMSCLAKTLLCVEQHCSMALVVLSTSSLLEVKGSFTTSPTVPLAMLTQHLAQHCPGFPVTQLNLCMRSSGNIAEAAGPRQVKAYRSGGAITPATSVLAQGTRSTVGGPRPRCILTKWTGYPNNPAIGRIDYRAIGRIDYAAISRGLASCLSSLSPTQLSGHIAVLCGGRVSPRRVAGLLPSSTLYDAGVEEYDYYGVPVVFPTSERREQRQSVRRWLTGKSGVLVTHGETYNGLEAPVVILVARGLGLGAGFRSHMLRAVGQLVVITNSDRAEEEEIKKQFDVTHVK